MANLKSSKKRVLIGIRNAAVNRVYKTTIKNLLKRYRQTIKVYLSDKNSENVGQFAGAISR